MAITTLPKPCWRLMDGDGSIVDDWCREHDEAIDCLDEIEDDAAVDYAHLVQPVTPVEDKWCHVTAQCDVCSAWLHPDDDERPAVHCDSPEDAASQARDAGWTTDGVLWHCEDCPRLTAPDLAEVED
jgi:hypothetical protein